MRRRNNSHFGEGPGGDGEWGHWGHELKMQPASPVADSPHGSAAQFSQGGFGRLCDGGELHKEVASDHHGDLRWSGL